MAYLKQDTTIKQYQEFIQDVYGLNDDRFFSSWDMLTNIERFATRGLKGIRKNDKARTILNLLIALSWLVSMLNQLHIDLETEVWKRFPYLCSYCGCCPCSCKEKKVQSRQEIIRDENKRPRTLEEFQLMFEKIYPAKTRTLEQAGIHMAEEVGELTEAMLVYRGGHKEEDFKAIPLEASDLFSCIMGVFNSMGENMAKELSLMFSDNCHECHQIPCQCNFTTVVEFKS